MKLWKKEEESAAYNGVVTLFNCSKTAQKAQVENARPVAAFSWCQGWREEGGGGQKDHFPFNNIQ